MKKQFTQTHFVTRIALMVIITIFCIIDANAQFDQKGNAYETKIGTAKLIKFSGKIDSLSTLSSNPFNLNGYNTDYYSYPLSAQKLFTSTSGTPKVKVIIQGTFNGSTYTNIDTIGVADSVESVVKANYDMNGAIYPQYRLTITGATNNRRDTLFEIYLYAYKKD